LNRKRWHEAAELPRRLSAKATATFVSEKIAKKNRKKSVSSFKKSLKKKKIRHDKEPILSWVLGRHPFLRLFSL